MSKFVTLHGFGGDSGGADLNFDVVGGTTEPTNPKENTIWVNTDKDIAGYYFQTTQPTNMLESEVWFDTVTESPVAFSALKKNTIMVYPLNAKQMVSGKLVDVTAKTYINGAWTDWFAGTYLFVDGDQCASVTGGWSSASGIPAGVINGGKLVVEGNQTFATNKSFSKGNNRKLCVMAESVGGNYHTLILNTVKGGLGSDQVIMEITLKKGLNTINLATVDVKFYLQTYIAYGDGSMEISKIWME